MKIRADEHVSKEIVRAVREMALTPGWELSHVVEVGDRGSTDEHWITKFGKEGGPAILTGDTDFLKRHQQIMAVSRAGMRIIHLPAKWANSRGALQASHILLWWRRIEAKVKEMSPLECFRAPWNISEDGDLHKITIDYHDAERKAKRAAKRVAKRGTVEDDESQTEKTDWPQER